MPSAVRRTRVSVCAPPLAPRGMMIRPPGASCSTKGGGTSGPPAATRIAWYGAYALHPSVPSPTRTETLLTPAPRSAAWAVSASELTDALCAELLDQARAVAAVAVAAAGHLPRSQFLTTSSSL